MSDLHRPNGTHDELNDPRHEPGTDTSPSDVDALDEVLNRIATGTRVSNTRSGSKDRRSNVRTQASLATGIGDDLGPVATSFHRRIEDAQAKRARASTPDPHLWENIMQATLPKPSSPPAARTVPRRRQRDSTVKHILPPYRPQRHPVWSMLANVGFVLVILAAGFGVWRASGGFGTGDGPDNTGLGVLWSSATPAGTGVCPPVSQSEGDADPEDFTDAAGLRDNLYNCVDEFQWPVGFEPDLEAIAGRNNLGDGRIDPGAARGTLGGLNECAWDITWLEARANGDAALEADALSQITDVIPTFGEPGLQRHRDEAAAEAQNGDSSEIEQFVSINCYPLWWTSHDATPPAAVGLATPEAHAATPVAQSGCDMTRDIPVLRYIGESPVAGTVLTITADGRLVLSCDAQPDGVTLALDVLSVNPLSWPGRVLITQRPERVDTPRQAIVDIATGKMIAVGRQPESMTYNLTEFGGSPWVVASAVDDPGKWLIVDLRTMESRLLSSYLTTPPPTDAIAFTANGAGGTLLVAPRAEGDGPLYGTTLVLDNSFDQSHVIGLSTTDALHEMTVSPDGQYVALVGKRGGDPMQGPTTYIIASTSDGTEVTRSESFDTPNPELRWVQDGSAIVFTQGADLNLLPVDGSGPQTIYSDPEPDIASLWDIRVTSDPDLILIGRDTAPGASEADEDAMARWWVAVNLATGETKTYEGLDVGYMSWFPVDRYLVMVDFANWQDPEITYTVFDALTGEEIGRIENVPNGAGQGIGKNSVTSSRHGDVKVIAFDSGHIFLIREVAGVAAVEQIASPEALAGIGGYVDLNMSSDGSMLMMLADSDPAHTRWMLDLTDDNAAWVEVPNSSDDDPGYIMFVNGTAKDIGE